MALAMIDPDADPRLQRGSCDGSAMPMRDAFGNIQDSGAMAELAPFTPGYRASRPGHAGRV